MSNVRKEVAKLRPIDDCFFHKLMEKETVCQEVLRVLLEDDNLVVLDKQPQEEIKNLQGRSVILDLFCRLGDGRLCDVEVQRAKKEIDHIRRVRYNAACLTANCAPTGDRNFERVPDIIIIYISEFDVLKKGKKIYHCETVCKETGESVKNGLTEIYVNTDPNTYDGTKISELMKCFTLPDFNHEDFPELSERVGHFKRNEGGIQEMCKVMEDYANEKVEIAVLDQQKKRVSQLFELGFGFEKVLELCADIPRNVIVEVYSLITGRTIDQ